MDKAPERAIGVRVHPTKRVVQMFILANGHPVPMASLDMTIEQAVAHRDAIQQAIIAAQQRRELILPSLSGLMPIMPS